MPKWPPSCPISFLRLFGSSALRLFQESQSQYAELLLYQKGDLALNKQAIISIMKSAEDRTKMVNQYQRHADRWKSKAKNSSDKEGLAELEANLSRLRHINMDIFEVSISILKKCGYSNFPSSSNTVKLPLFTSLEG